MMIHKVIRDPVFKSEVLFYNCKKGDDAIAHARKKYNITIENFSGFDGFKGSCVELYCEKTKITTWLIWIMEKKDWKSMVHESAHLVFRILDKRGIKYNSDNDETWCYLQEFFVAEFWHEMVK